MALLALLLLATFAVSLLLTTSTETLITASYRDAGEALHAAEAGLERALVDLAAASDWNGLLTSGDGLRAGTVSAFSGASLAPRLPGGVLVDLPRATNLANCPQVAPLAAAPCTAAQVQSAAPGRPWGANNPHWRLFAHGRLSDLLPGRIDSPFYVAVWTADDGAETDNDAAVDGGLGALDLDGDGEVDSRNPGAGIILVRAESFGPGGARRVVEAVVARTGGPPPERGYTGQRGLDAQGTGRRIGGVGDVGTRPTQLQMGTDGGLVAVP